MDNYVELLKLVLPGMLIEHFDLVKTTKELETLHLYFEEKNILPIEHPSTSGEIISKGFHNEVTIQDFPLRGKYVYLHIKRRRWTNKLTNEIVQRDWNLVAKGTRMTEEFAAFLKEISRY